MQTPTLHRNGTVIDPAEAVRSVRDIQAPDARELLRGLDTVPARVDTAISAAGDSIREASGQLRGTIHELSAPRRDRRLPIAWPWLVALAAGLTAIGLGAWWYRRSSPTLDLDDIDLSSIDREDLDRATGEGMGTAPGATDRLAAPTNGSSAELTGASLGH